jgi:hypothetical protein
MLQIASLLLGFMIALTGCTAASPTAIYPAGIVAPANWASGVRAGIYSSDAPKTCCFLAGHVRLSLDNPPGSHSATFTFYVPDVQPLRGQAERVTVSFNGESAGAPVRLATGMQDVTFTIPQSLRQQRNITASLDMSVKWVPKNIGLNADERELSVMLIRVSYT